MGIRIALAGNPNSGKTTLFNALTGANQYVGNWPGVTVEKKEGKLRGNSGVTITDLPGIYSLSPYTLEEVITRDYLTRERPDAIINLVDASNIERNLYLTTQLLEMGIPVVVALNMIDLANKRGDEIDLAGLSAALGCEVVELSALKGVGVTQVAERAIVAARGAPLRHAHIFDQGLEGPLTVLEDLLARVVAPETRRWYAVKLFERDGKAVSGLNLDAQTLRVVEEIVSDCERALDDDAESIITSARYAYIEGVVARCVRREKRMMTTSDKIDRIVTSRVLALPIFALVMFVVYYISITTVGTLVTNFTNDTLFGEWILPNLTTFLENAGAADWAVGLLVDGVVGGVGAVLGFVPQMIILFFMLCLLEDCGYMSRVAFIMDCIFRRFGLSGRSFIPMLIGSGCSVPGIMASRTIDQERDRRMTIITTSFIPCGAKMPIVGLIAGALFGGAWWVAPSAYFIGVAAVMVSGLMLKKTRAFAGEAAPFVMELPQYHVPSAGNVLRGTWERGWSFIVRAGTVILIASVFVWGTSNFGFVDGAFSMVEDMDLSILATAGNMVANLFAPLGFGTWQSTVATLLGLVAKEEVVGVFGVLYGVAGDALTLVEEGTFVALSPIAAHFTALSAFSFLVFNLLCAPCFAAMGAIAREMNSGKWTAFAIGYQTVFAYAMSLMVFQFGSFFTGGGFTVWTGVACAVLAGTLYLLLRRGAQASIPASPLGAVRREEVGV